MGRRDKERRGTEASEVDQDGRDEGQEYLFS
jgi:hypothetical protein